MKKSRKYDYYVALIYNGKAFTPEFPEIGFHYPAFKEKSERI